MRGRMLGGRREGRIGVGLGGGGGRGCGVRLLRWKSRWSRSLAESVRAIGRLVEGGRGESWFLVVD